METDNAAIMRQIYAAFNERAFDRACTLADPQVEVTFVPTGQVFRGQDGFEQFMRGHCAAFPDIRIELRQQITAGEHVVTEFTGHGTHTGALVTPNGEIPPTGRPVMIMACEVARLRDGRLAEVHNYQDLAGVLAQLGLMPQPQQAGEV